MVIDFQEDVTSSYSVKPRVLSGVVSPASPDLIYLLDLESGDDSVDPTLVAHPIVGMDDTFFD